MIIGKERKKVIENIRRAAREGGFHKKVEVGDPVLTEGQKEALIKKYLQKKRTVRFWVKNRLAGKLICAATKKINRETVITGFENISQIKGGAIITSNHFSPLDNTAVRTLAWRMGKKKLCIVSQETNLAMSGIIGFLMNYADILPISNNSAYMSRRFEPLLNKELDKESVVLIYPEQEMWFNYRKPRPLKRGAYYYAAKFGVPVISCFVEMKVLKEMDTREFHKVNYVVHVLPAIYPDGKKSVRENSLDMCLQDYEQKKKAYETAYGKALDYEFEEGDIAGWVPGGF